MTATGPDTCGLCGREVIKGPSADEHHLIPKSFKGKVTETIHRVCHTKIHSVFTEKELAVHYHTFDRLKEHDEIKKFIKWVAKKPPDFYTKNEQTNRKRGR